MTQQVAAARGPRRRTLLGFLGTVALSVALVAAPSSAHAASTYPAEVTATWTKLKGTATKKITAKVQVTALGGYPVKGGTVQICEDTRCYGEKVTLDKYGKATVSAIVPRDAAGVKSLDVVYDGKGKVYVQGYGETAFQARAWQSDQTEATIAKYKTTTKAKVLNTKGTVKQGKAIKFSVTVASKQPTIYQYKNGKKEKVAIEKVNGQISVLDSKGKVLKNFWVKNGKGTFEFDATKSRLAKGTHTLKVKFKGSNYHDVSTGTFKIKVT